jgi:predicted RNase H-like HicB family nuclease
MLHRSIKAFVTKGDTHFVAHCLEINVVTQGRTLDETVRNLQEAVALFLEGEDLAEFELSENPSLLITMEIEPAGYAP